MLVRSAASCRATAAPGVGGIRGLVTVVDQNERQAVDHALRAAAARHGAVPVELTTGRSCGTCMMCCKVYTIHELNKPAGRWCVHAERGCGCKIYEARPDTCRRFYCMWIVDPTLGPEWKPEKAHFVVSLDLLGYQALTISLDASRPDAWRKEPYYSTIKGWAKKFCPENKKVLVVDIRGAVTVVLPDRDVPIGAIAPHRQEIVVFREGATYEVGVQPRVAAPAAEAASGQPIMAMSPPK
jgi:Fe-S-cluster containining protein